MEENSNKTTNEYIKSSYKKFGFFNKYNIDDG